MTAISDAEDSLEILKDNDKLPKVPNSPKKVVRQKWDRRKKSLIHKAYEYSKLCDANIYLVIRIRESGQVTTFQADSTGFWSGFSSHLVGDVACGRCPSAY